MSFRPSCFYLPQYARHIGGHRVSACRRAQDVQYATDNKEEQLQAAALGGEVPAGQQTHLYRRGVGHRQQE